jgi:dTDP-4-amino-4,6-dideoxygalactose transaminase
MIPLNDLSRSQDIADGSLLQGLEGVLLSGNYILGPSTTLFEQSLAKYLGVGDACAVASGTDALVISLRALNLQPGSLVATTPNSGGYATTAIRQVGLLPIYVDCQENGGMSPASLSGILANSKEVSAVIVTHLYGLASSVKEIAEICDDFQLPLIEDCAQSLGAKFDGKFAGSFGTLATFSFYPTKNLGALGDAGAIASSDPGLSARIRSLRQYGWSTRYVTDLEGGTNSRIDEFQASVLLKRLPNLQFANAQRRAIWKRYRDALNSPWRIIGSDDENFVAHLAVVLCPEGERGNAAQYLQSEKISTSIHYPILDYRQNAWVQLESGDCQTAENLTSRILTIPLFPELSELEIQHICNALTTLSRQ